MQHKLTMFDSPPIEQQTMDPFTSDHPPVFDNEEDDRLIFQFIQQSPLICPNRVLFHSPLRRQTQDEQQQPTLNVFSPTKASPTLHLYQQSPSLLSTTTVPEKEYNNSDDDDDDDVEEDEQKQHQILKRMIFEMRCKMDHVIEENQVLKDNVQLLSRELRLLKEQYHELEGRLNVTEKKILDQCNDDDNVVRNENGCGTKKAQMNRSSNGGRGGGRVSQIEETDQSSLDVLMKRTCDPYRSLLLKTGLTVEKLRDNVYEIGEYKVCVVIKDSELYVQLGSDRLVRVCALLDQLLSGYVHAHQ